MRVLVTGAAGFVGRHVVEYLQEKEPKWDVVGTDRQDGPAVRLLFDLRDTLPQSSRWGGDVDAIINLAAAADVEDFLREPIGRVLDNVDTTLHVLEWARTQPLRHFIQVSTNEVFGPTISGCLNPDELAPIRPATPYSASKAAQEALAIAWWHSYQVPTTIVTTMHLFGEHQPIRRFIPQTIRKLERGLPVPVYGCRLATSAESTWRSSSRCWLYVRDFADALHWVLTTREPGDRWNVAGPEMSCEDVVGLIARELGVGYDIAWFDVDEARPGHELRYVLDVRKIVMAGWVPPHGGPAGLKRTIEWVRGL